MPAVIPGTYPQKKDSACQTYVGLLFFDLDHIGTADAQKGAFEVIQWRIEELLKKLKRNHFVFAAYPSPSGQGMRVLVWTNSSIESHKAYYESICANLSEFLDIPTDKALRAELKAQGKNKSEIDQAVEQSEIIDTSTSNPARIWFYSHVPKDLFYLNLDSQVYVLKDLKRPQTNTTPKNGFQPVSEDEKVTILLDKVNRQGIPGGRNNFVFAYASELCRHSVPVERALGECLAFREDGFDEREIEKTVESAYKSTPFGEFTDAQFATYKKTLQSNTITSTPLIDAKPQASEDKNELREVPEESEDVIEAYGEGQTKLLRIQNGLSARYDFRLNIIANEIEYSRKDKNAWKLLNENNLVVELMLAGFTGVEQPLLALLKSDFFVPRYDPFRAYFENLPPWNEITDPDFIVQLANYVEGKDQHWFNTQFKKALVRTAALALGVLPFNKHCFTLKGEQNDGKSSFLRFLVPPALKDYTADHFDPNNKDGLFALCQNFIINLDELSQFTKADIRRVKAIFTYDRVKERLPYDRRPTNHKRRASFVASTNDDEFLIDETGNVRWLVFEIAGIKHDNGGKDGYSKNIDIDRVWAQAYTLLRNGFNFNLTPDEIAKSERNNRNFQKTTIEMEYIEEFYEPAKSGDENGKWVQVKDILEKVRNKTGLTLNEVNAGRAMKFLGFEKGQFRPSKGQAQRKGYFVIELSE